jgi:hypothetical protein
MFELGEDLLDRVQVRGVFGQEDQFGSARADRLSDGVAFVAAEVVLDDPIARLERWRLNRLDVDFERLSVDRTIENPGCLDADRAGLQAAGLPIALDPGDGRAHRNCKLGAAWFRDNPRFCRTLNTLLTRAASAKEIPSRHYPQ